MMKKLVIALTALLPTMVMAQNTWERPQDFNQQTTTKEVKVKEKKQKEEKPTIDPRYLEGGVPEVDGKIVFTLERDLPGMSADDIYQRLYTAMGQLTQSEEQHDSKQSQIAVVNKAEHTIAARYKEWLVFQNSFLSLDRTVFCYTLIARATDGHVKVTMERMSYQYEKERSGSSGLDVKAEDWIADKVALNKKKTGLVRMCSKFRIKTIDRKDQVFVLLTDALGVK